MRQAFAVVLVPLCLFACEDKHCPEATTTVATAQPVSTGAGATPKLSAKNNCFVGDESVGVHAVIESSFTASAAGRTAGQTDHKSRTLWSIACSYLNRQWVCTCSHLDLLEIESHGGNITANDIGAISGVEVAAKTGSTATLRIGGHTTFTLDNVKKTVAYSESGFSGEGRGEASCPPSWEVK